MAREAYQTFIEQHAVQNMEALRGNPYPGRGIVMGLNKQGDQAIQVYWVMGRSENSRNRVLARDGDTVRTEPFDASKVQDPSLIIYTAMRVVNGVHIVSNGDQTDSVADAIGAGETFEGALKQRTHEPDAPNFTPRITGEYIPNSNLPFSLSIIGKDPSGGTEPVRSLYSFGHANGIGDVVHTYKGDGDPLPSFDGKPYPVLLEGPVDEIAQTYWDLLNPDNRVSLVAKGISIKTGEVSFSIINKHTK